MGLIRRLIKTYKRYNVAYIAVDLHDTVLKPTYSKTVATSYFPLAKRVLQYLSNRKDVKLIMWTSSHDNDIEQYKKLFALDNIKFDFINSNPECESNEYANFKHKMYFDLGLDDRCGFNPYTDWIKVYLFYIIRNYLYGNKHNY